MRRMRSEHDPPTTPAQLLCECLADVLQPSHLGELLLLAVASRCRAMRVAPADWDTFAHGMLDRARARPERSVSFAELAALVLDDGSVRDRVKTFLRAAAAADPVDAQQDAELLARLMRGRLEEVLGWNAARYSIPQGTDFGGAEVRPNPRSA
jgi:hypothetical protein